MTASPDQHANLEALREGLRKGLAVAEFAQRMAREASVPPGLVTDFMEARTSIEREFVRVHQTLSPDLRKRLKELLLKTKGLTPEVMGRGAAPLVDRLRGVLNDLMIDGGMSLSLTEEAFAKAENETDANLTAGVAQLLNRPPEKARAPAAKRSLPPAIAVVVIFIVLAAAFVGAWGAGLFTAPTVANAGNTQTGGNAANDAPPANARANAPAPDNEANSPFDRAAAGYTRALRAQPMRPSLNPLDTDLDLAAVATSEWPLLQLGLEELVAALDPSRLKLMPDETRRRLSRFADSTEKADLEWIAARRKFLDAFVDHVRAQLQLAPFSDGKQALISDVLAAKGGPRLVLLMTWLALARACNADLVLIAPVRLDFALLAQRVKGATATFDGELLGLRPTHAPEIKPQVLLAAQCELLRKTLEGKDARLACSAMLLRCNGKLDADQARDALADLDLTWFGAGANPDTRPIMEPAARLLAPAICTALLDATARGDAPEAARVLDLALAASLAPQADRALLVLAERAEKGATYRNEPLALVVAKLLLKRGDKPAATQWFKRAMEEFPDHWQSALDFAATVEDSAQKRALYEAAYARGCRTPDFLRSLARMEAQAGAGAAALAALDDILALESVTMGDVRDAALLCLSLERPRWAQERIAASKFAKEPELLRLDLICELALNGLSERAKELAKAYGKRGNEDPYIESLLQRFGG